MSSTISGAVWVAGDIKSRQQLGNAVNSAIGNTQENSKGLPKEISKLVVEYLEEFQIFGESEWRTLCKTVSPAPPLPRDFSDIWYGPCPFYPGMTVSQTHMIVYIPAKVNGKPFTLKKLGKIAKPFFSQNNKGEGKIKRVAKRFFQKDKGHAYIWANALKKLRNKPIKSGWVLMTREVLPGSRNKSYVEQQKMVTALADKPLGYKVPGTLQAATCILAQYFYDSKKKIRLFNDKPLTYTRCIEKVIGGYQAVVGGFSPVGLLVYTHPNNSGSIGVAAVREL